MTSYRPELEMSSCANLALLKLLMTKIHSKYINYVIQISLSGNAKSQLSLQCSLDLTENLVLKSLNPNLVAAKVSESVKNLINQERHSVMTKEMITVDTNLDLDTFSKPLPFFQCSIVNSLVNDEKLNVEDQASRKSIQNESETTPKPSRKSIQNWPITTPKPTESTQKYQQMSTSATNANTSNTTRLIKTTNPTYSTNADAPNTTRRNKTTDPTFSINTKDTTTFISKQSTAEPKEDKIIMIISIGSTIFIAVGFVFIGILIYICKRGFNFSSDASTAVQFRLSMK
ncbi:hypothetical protein BgiMline_031897 [Biomphalaria glabrata]|nr:hypothetical protein BgiMline_020077 [Biomphalaria glabrata]